MVAETTYAGKSESDAAIQGDKVGNISSIVIVIANLYGANSRETIWVLWTQQKQIEWFIILLLHYNYIIYFYFTFYYFILLLYYFCILYNIVITLFTPAACQTNYPVENFAWSLESLTSFVRRLRFLTMVC